MTGMVVVDYLGRTAEFRGAMVPWVKEGKIKTREHIVEGFEKFAETLLMLFKGENEGKLVIKVAAD